MNANLLIAWLIQDGEEQFSGKVAAGIKGTKGNSNYTTLQPQVTAIETGSYPAYLTAKADAAQGGVENTAIRNARRGDLVSDLRPLINNINAIANGDLEMLMSSGFPVRKTTRTPIGPLPTPQAPFVSQGPVSGTQKASTPAIYGAALYVAQIALASAPSTVVQTKQSTGSRFLFENLIAGEVYNTKVMAIGAAGPTDWSDDATMRVI